MLDRLREKGWAQDELDHLTEHFSPRHEGLFLIVILCALLVFALVGVPYAYAVLGHLLTDSLFYLLLVVVGAPLGAVFGVLLVDMYRLSHKHHTFLLVAIPVACIGATAWMISFAARSAPSGAYTHNALIGGCVYAISFIAPYAFLVQQEWNSRIAYGNS